MSNDAITKELVLQQRGTFTWMFGQEFFIETGIGNFVWKDPDYDGDNTMTLFDGSYEEFRKTVSVGHGRDKGTHPIREYCGEDFTLVLNSESPRRIRTTSNPRRKVPVSIRLDREVVDFFKRDGAGFMSRINEALKAYVRDQIK